MPTLPVLMLVLVAGALSAADSHLVAIGGPRLIIDGGVVLPGSTTTLVVAVKNPAATPRTWATPMLSCACAAVQPAAELFPAARSGLVTMQVRWPLGHAPAEATAEMHFTAPDGGSAERATVTVTGRIEDYLLLDERGGTYRLATTSLASAASGWDIDVSRGRHPEVWDDLSAEVSEPGLLASVARIDHDHWRIHLAPTTAMPLGSFGSSLVFAFRRDGQALDHRVARRVVGRVSGPVRATPGEVLLGAIPPGASVERTLRVQAVDGSAVTVLEAVVEPGITATVSPDDPAVVILRVSAPAEVVKPVPVGGYLHLRVLATAGTFQLRILLVGTLIPARANDTP